MKKSFKTLRSNFRLGFYGHSICASSPANKGSYQELLKHYYGERLKIINIGAGQASEERILYELKKTKDLDCAIIFHSRPGSVFLLGSNNDFYLADDISEKADYLFSRDKRNIEEILFRSIKKVFPDPETFVETFNLYKKYLSNPDIEKNRFEGALLAIDSYCNSKIPHVYVYHCIDERYKPTWFDFKSGIRDSKLEKIIENQKTPTFPNCLTYEQNYEVFEHIQCNILDKII